LNNHKDMYLNIASIAALNFKQINSLGVGTDTFGVTLE